MNELTSLKNKHYNLIDVKLQEKLANKPQSRGTIQSKIDSLAGVEPILREVNEMFKGFQEELYSDAFAEYNQRDKEEIKEQLASDLKTLIQSFNKKYV